MSRMTRVIVSLSCTFVFGKRVVIVNRLNDFKCAKGYTVQKKTKIAFCVEEQTFLKTMSKNSIVDRVKNRSTFTSFLLEIDKNNDDFEQK